MDQGKEGLTSTMKLCEKSGIEYTGVGMNIEEASRICLKEIKGRKIAIVNICEIEFSVADENSPGTHPLDPVRNFYTIQDARKVADEVIVIVHGGHEGYSLPSPWMTDNYRFFVDAGASVVVGHHPHCYSGFEKYGNGMIFYSLGNFIFDSPSQKETDWNFGYAIELSLNNSGFDFKTIPYKQCSDQPGVVLLNDVEHQKFEQQLQKLSQVIGDQASLMKHWDSFAKSRSNEYTRRFECFDFRLYNALRYKNYLPSTLSKKKRMKMLNLMRCISHRELSIEALKE
jgi:poly-gamma-glutamate synthesis protein (capsule biosynthesis protein)